MGTLSDADPARDRLGLIARRPSGRPARELSRDHPFPVCFSTVRLSEWAMRALM